jgi:thiosulfate/3-mercaptopyruvate sulfurtransferase
MLRVTGHASALLDGGLQAWAGPLASAATAPPPAAQGAAPFTSRPWPADRIAMIDEAAAWPGMLIDARQRERYAGAPDALDPRAGHIPGARSLPSRENLDETGRLLPVEALRERFAAVGITGPDAEVVSYCGSGVTACHNLLALEHSGLGVGRLYPGSWSQWSRDPSRPVALGEELGKGESQAARGRTRHIDTPRRR